MSLVGHVGPGTGYVLMGSFLFLRSLKDIRFLDRLHSKFSLLTVGVFQVVVGILFAIVEYIGVYKTGWKPTSSQDHFTMYLLLFFMGTIDLLHKKYLIRENYWALFNPIGYILISVIFWVHLDAPFPASMHTISGYIQFIGGMSWVIQIIISVSVMNKQNQSRSQLAFSNDEEQGIMMKEFNEESENETNDMDMNDLDGDSSSSHINNNNVNNNFNDKNEITHSFHPLFLERSVFNTVFPTLSGFCFILNGLWWIDMGFRLYVYHIDITEHISRYTTLLLLQYICYLILSLALISALLRLLDRKLCGKCKKCPNKKFNNPTE